jgi:hypothetical protein
MTIQHPDAAMVPLIDLHPDCDDAIDTECVNLSDRDVIALLQSSSAVVGIVDPAVDWGDRNLRATVDALFDLLESFRAGARRPRDRLYLPSGPDRETELVHALLRLADYGLAARVGTLALAGPTGPIRRTIALVTSREEPRLRLRFDPTVPLLGDRACRGGRAGIGATPDGRQARRRQKRRRVDRARDAAG